MRVVATSRHPWSIADERHEDRNLIELLDDRAAVIHDVFDAEVRNQLGLPRARPRWVARAASPVLPADNGFLE